MVSIITKDATIRLHEVVRRGHEDSGPRRRPACVHESRQTLDGESTSISTPSTRRWMFIRRRRRTCRSAATRARRAWASRLGIGVAWQKQFWDFFFCLYALRTCRSRRRASRAGRARSEPSRSRRSVPCASISIAFLTFITMRALSFGHSSQDSSQKSPRTDGEI